MMGHQVGSDAQQNQQHYLMLADNCPENLVDMSTRSYPGHLEGDVLAWHAGNVTGRVSRKESEVMKDMSKS